MNRQFLNNYFKPRVWIQFTHLWLALTLGAFVVLIVFTGSLLLFRSELEPLVYRDLYRVSSGQPIPLSVVIAGVQKAYPDFTLETLELPLVTHGALRLEVSQGERKGTVFIDPNSGQINGYQAQFASLFDWLLSLHRELLLRPTELTEDTNYGHAHRLVGWIALVLLTLLLGGLVLWFPRVKQWRSAWQLRRKNAFLWNYDAHKLIGIGVIVPLLAIISVVLPYTFYKDAHQLLDAVSYPKAPDPERRFSFDSKPIDLDGVIRTAQSYETGLQAVRVQLEDSPLTVVLSSPNDPTRNTGKFQGDVELGVSASSGAITSVQDTRTWNLAARVVSSTLYMGIHAGTWGGLVTRLLTLLVSIATLYLAWTGVRQWWLKRSRKRLARVKALRD